MRLDENANGSEVRLSVMQQFDIVLSETPTSGYRWSVVSDGAPVCRVDRDSFEPPKPVPGAPGRHSWTFTTVQAGTATIQLAYARSFGSAEPAKRFALRVVVQ